MRKDTTGSRLLRKTRWSADGCWVWTASLDRKGYGRLHHNGKARGAHRVAYEIFVGPIPAGMQLDHLCRNRACVNPRHLEPVTNQENSRRGVAGEVVRARKAAQTHCKNGHPLDGDNLIAGRSFPRNCLACARLRMRKSGRVLGPKRRIVGAPDLYTLLLDCGHTARRTRPDQKQRHCGSCETVLSGGGL